MHWRKGLFIKAFFVISVPPLVTLRMRAHMGSELGEYGRSREGCDGKSE